MSVQPDDKDDGSNIEDPKSGNPKIKDPTDDSNTIKDPDDWTTGDEEMTGAQRSYLKTLCEEARSHSTTSSPKPRLQNESTNFSIRPAAASKHRRSEKVAAEHAVAGRSRPKLPPSRPFPRVAREGEDSVAGRDFREDEICAARCDWGNSSPLSR